MARLLQKLIDTPHDCPYLSEQKASLEHQIMLEITPDEFEAMLCRGYRRFGPDYFRPVCAGCSSCLPIRIPTKDFPLSRSQKRAMKNMSQLIAVLGPPRLDDERLDLYQRWHADREAARDWTPQRMDKESYYLTFAFPHPCVREIAYYDDLGRGRRKLVGVGICDETANAWSAVYFYFDPGYAHMSLGVGNILFQIRLAASRQRPYVYLGYYVPGCVSMQYKRRFRPQEFLVGWPSMDEAPEWKNAADILPDDEKTLEKKAEHPESAQPSTAQLGGGTGTVSSV